MLPRSDIELRREIDYTALSEPGPDSLEGGQVINRQYMPLGADPPSWEEAASLLGEEREAVAEISAEARDDQEFEDLAGDRGEALVWEGEFFNGLDLGMEALCAALAAAGCLTSASCRGHPGAHAWASFPMVILGADPRRAAILEAAAAESGCGIASDSEGLLEVWAPSLAETFAMAECVIARRAEFDLLGVPRWRVRPPESGEDVIEIHPGQQELFADGAISEE